MADNNIYNYSIGGSPVSGKLGFSYWFSRRIMVRNYRRVCKNLNIYEANRKGYDMNFHVISTSKSFCLCYAWLWWRLIFISEQMVPCFIFSRVLKLFLSFLDIRDHFVPIYTSYHFPWLSVKLALFLLLNLEDPRTANWPLMSSPLPTLTMVLSYIIFVTFGPRLMRNRDAFNPYWLLIFYNFGLVILSFYMMVEV